MMPLTYKTLCLGLLFFQSWALLTAQSFEQTITVTGSSTVNVSPNEIIIEIRYQEYFEGTEEEPNRVSIDQIESKVLKALGEARIEDEKITLGGINVVRPTIYRNNERIFLKRRLSKTLMICVETTDQLLKVVRQLEKANLMDEIITTFEIVETKHTDIESYQKQVKVDAFKDAQEKANLILSTAAQKPGDVVTIREIPDTPMRGPMEMAPSTYSFEETPGSSISGFKPIQVKYKIEVVFMID
jgi:uncharacterized protein YggE